MSMFMRFSRGPKPRWVRTASKIRLLTWLKGSVKAMRSRRGSFDDAFSPLMAMPSVVDMDQGVRMEKDLLGAKEVPKAAYYGAALILAKNHLKDTCF